MWPGLAWWLIFGGNISLIPATAPAQIRATTLSTGPTDTRISRQNGIIFCVNCVFVSDRILKDTTLTFLTNTHTCAMWMLKLMLDSTLSSESLGQSSWIGQSYCSPLLCPCGLSHHTNSELSAEASPLLLARTALLCWTQQKGETLL